MNNEQAFDQPNAPKLPEGLKVLENVSVTDSKNYSKMPTMQSITPYNPLAYLKIHYSNVKAVWSAPMIEKFEISIHRYLRYINDPKMISP